MNEPSDEQEREEEEYERHEEEQIHHEEAAPHSEGDLRTWLILGLIVAGAIVHTFLIRWIVGRHIAAPDGWNLGYPPTSPSALWSLFF